jgi:hypothetical protein
VDIEHLPEQTSLSALRPAIESAGHRVADGSHSNRLKRRILVLRKRHSGKSTAR